MERGMCCYGSYRCVEMVIPWQLCQIIGPLLQRLPLASAKAQPRGDFHIESALDLEARLNILCRGYLLMQVRTHVLTLCP